MTDTWNGHIKQAGLDVLKGAAKVTDTTSLLTRADEAAADITAIGSSREIIRELAEALRGAEKERRLFPIQRSSPIPWALAERAYDTYARLFGTSQSLKRLGERGGFGLQEYACLFAGHEPTKGHTKCVEKSDAVGRKIAELEQQLREQSEARERAELQRFALNQVINMDERKLATLSAGLQAAVRQLSGDQGIVGSYDEWSKWPWMKGQGYPADVAAIRKALELLKEEKACP